ncbi:FAD-dependent monooxygenase [Actinoplanes sp. N902-109]|uniref:FAD-dependent monooxygenase n=1 Tax=Actinoplanes sp. (strain N902-109) TaxID=649831 RepID=UPI0003295495|nr:FAD-dependent monooxygenase [Actinoplanes sp. N902-109]AGL13669.1 putative monooxygenase [Actinoplanes sp. N902-109]
MTDLSDNEAEVIIVGAGPVGLWLAAELRLAGVDTMVLERAAEPVPHPKALGLHARTLEQLALRGAVDAFLAGGVQVPAWHFGFLEQRLDLTRLDSPYPFLLSFPQDRTEALLQQRALDLGARIIRSQEVVGLDQDDTGVRLTTASGASLHAGWVVGADGAGSAVRRLTEIDFPGTDADVYAYLGDVHAEQPPPPGYGVQNERGALIVAPLPGGVIRVTGYDPENQEPGRREVTLTELSETATRITGADFGLHDPTWLTRFGNATRVAARYRQGRVLLAGDAAHMHFPAGGVGLNLGLQDATNLGWKLAAVAQDRAPATLLDTYGTERRPWALDVAEHTLAQTALITATTPTGQALRRLLSGLIGTLPDLSLTLARRLAGVDVRYPAAAGAHPLTGTSLTAGLELRDARPALVTAPGVQLPPPPGIRVVELPSLPGATAALIRPDGHVWWATSEQHPAAAAQQALASFNVRF